MAYAPANSDYQRPGHEEKLSLLHEWRRLTRAATFVAILTSPAFFTILYKTYGWSLGASLVCTFIGVIAFRGLVDVLAHKLIPTPSLYGADRELLDDDIVARRRLWYWRKAFRRLVWIGGTLFGALLVINIIQSLTGHPQSLGGTLSDIGDMFAQLAPLLLVLGIQLPMLFFINFFILFGPLLFFGLKQMKGYEPGDADWGVRLEDVRGQKEPKEESRA